LAVLVFFVARLHFTWRWELTRAQATLLRVIASRCNSCVRDIW
jgi:hypothetical protein